MRLSEITIKGIKMKVKDINNKKKNILIEQVSDFCDKNLDNEYKELCLKMIEKMARKRTVPFLSGKLEIWAAAIIYAIGQINFLFDKSFTPYQSADDICNYFNTSKSTTSQKAKLIRDMFKLNYYDKYFSTQKMSNSNPFNELVMINNFIVPKRIIDNE